MVVGALLDPREVGGLVGRGVGSNNKRYFDPSSLLPTSNSLPVSPRLPLLIGVLAFTYSVVNILKQN